MADEIIKQSKTFGPVKFVQLEPGVIRVTYARDINPAERAMAEHNAIIQLHDPDDQSIIDREWKSPNVLILKGRLEYPMP